MDGDDTEAVVRNLGDGLDDEECPEKVQSRKDTEILKKRNEGENCKKRTEIYWEKGGGAWCNSPEI
jgi:hypothetical protein